MTRCECGQYPDVCARYGHKSRREFMDCRECHALLRHTRTAGCILVAEVPPEPVGPPARTLELTDKQIAMIAIAVSMMFLDPATRVCRSYDPEYADAAGLMDVLAAAVGE
jgi:hypothetical protein